MIELYHSVNSVCAQKVRIVLEEKKLPWTERLMTLQGDQFDPAYLKLNPNAVVPTLVHDGLAVIESSIILYYLDERFPEPPLMPADPRARVKVRAYNKLIDEYLHNACTTLSFATAFRARMVKMTPQQLDEMLDQSPSAKRSEFKRDVIARGLDSKFVVEALRIHEKMLTWMEESLSQGDYLAGDSVSLADIAVIPYILRLDLIRLSRMWDGRRGIADWYARMRARPTVVKALLEPMTEAHTAPFRSIEPDPWPIVERLLQAG